MPGAPPVGARAARDRVDPERFGAVLAVVAGILPELPVPLGAVEVGGPPAERHAVVEEEPFENRGSLAAVRYDVLHQCDSGGFQFRGEVAVLFPVAPGRIDPGEVDRVVSHGRNLHRREVEDVEPHLPDPFGFPPGGVVEVRHLEFGAVTAVDPAFGHAFGTIPRRGLAGSREELRQVVAERLPDRAGTRLQIERIEFVTHPLFRPSGAAHGQFNAESAAPPADDPRASLLFLLLDEEQGRAFFLF